MKSVMSAGSRAAIAVTEAAMQFSRMSDGIALHDRACGQDEHSLVQPSRALWAGTVFDSGSSGEARRGGFVASSSPHLFLPASRSANADTHASSDGTDADHTNVHAFGSPSEGSALAQAGADAAGNGGSGSFYGGLVHGALLIYEPVNLTVAAGYSSLAIASQDNHLHLDQSALQIAGVGGDGGNGNQASGGSPGTFLSDAGLSDAAPMAAAGNQAGNGGAGYFLGAVVNAPIVIYHPVNIAIASSGGTAVAGQVNDVEVDQSAVQAAGLGGDGGSGNIAASNSVISLEPGWASSGGWLSMVAGGTQSGNGGEGHFSGALVHASVLVYDPINIAVAGYHSSAYALQSNSLSVDQSTVQLAGIGGDGGSGNIALANGAGIHPPLSGGASSALAPGALAAGDGGDGHFTGSLIDVSLAIYAPINIAIAGPYSTAEADQINSLQLDQSAIQLAGIGGHGGAGNLALGGDLAAHLLSDLHLFA